MIMYDFLALSAWSCVRWNFE